MPKILLVDHSGRGHAFADLFVRTNPEAQVYYAPGCPAITTERIISLPHLTLADPEPMAAWARDEQIDIVFVANAMALAQGFVDVFRRYGLRVVGPDQQASRLESSKVYTKQLCVKYNIPVADFVSFDQPEAARDYVQQLDQPVVIKADGLCGGNGTFVCDSAEAAFTAIDKLMVQRVFGAAGDQVVIEQKLLGTELLFFVLVDGKGFKMLPMAVDYPRSDDGNTGVMCGGMGAFSPHPHETEALTQQFTAEILQPVLRCIQGENLNFTGVIYIGCMLVGSRMYLLEINARMGEPEAEVVLPRIHSDFVAVCEAILHQRLDQHPPLIVDDLYYCDVVAVQGRTRQMSNGRSKGWYQGWPYGRHGKHYPITGLEQIDPAQCKIFIGQAALHPTKGLVTDGGRCLHVVGFGATHQAAVDHAYANIDKIHFDGIRYRSDIGSVLPW
jgi:phosphoribosylamine--glycine ligase